MLSWEYPPHISGGLGTACQGLAQALAELGVPIDLALPRLYGGERAAERLRLHAALGRAQRPPAPGGAARPSAPGGVAPPSAPGAAGGAALGAGTVGPARPLAREAIDPYQRPPDAPPPELPESAWTLAPDDRGVLLRAENPIPAPTAGPDPQLLAALAAAREADLGLPAAWRDLGGGAPARAAPYAGDLFAAAEGFATGVAALAEEQSFDLVHAHDWLTWPAALRLARRLGLPFVAHVHSLEQDRAGGRPDPRILAIERAGLSGADRVLAVSRRTAAALVEAHAVPSERIAVVHNGVYPAADLARFHSEGPADRPIVLFLGRLTLQKGPAYFIRAAAHVVPQLPEALFVVAGAGDLLPALQRLVAELGLEPWFHFTGFLEGEDLERAYAMADLYVMPSVSEPFGIAALEALSYETPVLVSRQSGVAEVLPQAMQVDFWDAEGMADRIIGALRQPALRAELVARSRADLRRLHWTAAAERVREVYRALSV